MKILCLSPHPDDVELGCGGTVKKFTKNGHDVKVIVFSNCENSLKENGLSTNVLYEENKKSMAVLGVNDVEYLDMPNRELFTKRAEILDYLFNLNQEERFDIVFIPWIEDAHQDHETVAEEGLRAFRRSDVGIVMYRVTATRSFDPNIFVPLAEDEIQAKLDALNCYKSQKDLRKHFDPEITKSYAIIDGVNIKEDFAEGFVLHKGKFFVF